MPAPSVIDNYAALPPREAFNIEYWQLEEAKLRRLPAEKPLSRKVAVVIGTSPGIGRLTAEKLAQNGAHVVAADINASLAEETAEELQKAFGNEMATAEHVDCTDRYSVCQMLERVTMQFGGIDIMVCVAAVFFPPDVAGRTTDDQWRKTFDVNLHGSYIGRR
jgi:NAD(P)-dependent dehydrogenase (short-subunit alcohol dehydrogenase family)